MNIGTNLEYLTSIAAEFLTNSQEFKSLNSAKAALQADSRYSALLFDFEKKQEAALSTNSQSLLQDLNKDFETLSRNETFSHYFKAAEQFSKLFDEFVATIHGKIKI